MSVPDRLMDPYLKAWTEWTDEEIALVLGRVADRSLHPMDLKKILAGEVVTALYGLDAAMAARAGFVAQFSKKSFADVDSLPVVDVAAHGAETVAAVLTKVLEFTPSASAARRLAKQNALRLVVEGEDGQQTVVLAEAESVRPLAEVLAEKLVGKTGTAYLKAGRKLAQLEGR